MFGTFKARAKEWGLGHSTTGKEQAAVMFEITEGEHAGQRRTWYGYFTDDTIDRTLDSLRHCGWSGDNIADLTGLDANEVEIVIAEEEYEGKTRDKVQWVNRPARLALKQQMSPDAVKAFAAKLRGKTTQHKQKYGPQPTPSAQPQSRSNGQRSNSSSQGGDPHPGYGGHPADEDPF